MDSKQTIVLFLFFAFTLNITLCQVQVPAPYNLVVTSVTSTSVTLGWVAPAFGTGYKITSTDRNGKEVGNKLSILPINKKSATISGLKVYTKYTFTIATVTRTSSSETISINAVTLPQPTSIRAVPVEGNSVVTFTITCEETKDIHYELLLELRQGGKLVLRALSEINVITVSGLSTGTYNPTVIVKVDNYAGEPFTGKPVTVAGVAARYDATEPSNLRPQVTGTSIFLMWAPATKGAGYLVTVDMDRVPYYIHNLHNSKFAIEYLEPCTEYSFTIRTTSEGTKKSQPVTLKGTKTKGPTVTWTSAKEMVPASGKVTVYWNPIKINQICKWLFDINLHANKLPIYLAYASGSASSYELYNVAAGDYEIKVSTSVDGSLGQAGLSTFKKTYFPPGQAVSPPKDLKVTGQTSYTISLSWTPVTEAVGYQYMIGNGPTKYIIDGGLVKGTKITGLSLRSTYTIYVCSLTESSASKYEQISGTTISNIN